MTVRDFAWFSTGTTGDRAWDSGVWSEHLGGAGVT